MALLICFVLLLACVWLATVASVLSALRTSPRRLRVATAEEAPAACADLFERDEQALAALGFVPLGWAATQEEHSDAPPAVGRVLLHRETATVAVLQPNALQLQQPNRLIVSLITRFEDGSSLTSVRQLPVEDFFSAPPHERRSIDADNLQAFWQAHRQACEERQLPPVFDTPDLASWCAWLQTQWQQVFDSLVADGRFASTADGRLRLRLAHYPRFFRLAAADPKAQPGEEVPLARQAFLFSAHERDQSSVPTPLVQWLCMLLLTAGFAGFLSLALSGDDWQVNDLWIALWLWLVLVLHEGGRYLAMRLLGFRGVRLPVVAFIGKGTVGMDPTPSGLRTSLVALAGTVPGIVFGWAWLSAWFGASSFLEALVDMVASHNVFLTAGAITPLVFNYLLLLPLPGLEGHKLLQSLLPPGRSWPAFVVAALALIGVLMYLTRWGGWIGLIILLWQAFAWSESWREGRAVRAYLAADSSQPPVQRLMAACQSAAPKAGFVQRFECARAVRARVQQVWPRPGLRALLLVCYLALFALPLLHPVGRGALWLLQVWGTS